MNTKSILKSTTIWASVVSMLVGVLKLGFGIEGLDANETNGVIDALMGFKTELLIIVSAGGSIWSRIVATNFDKSIFQTKTFWFKAAQGVAFILQAFGAAVDPLAAADLAAQTFTLISDGVGIGAVIVGIAGRVMAKQPVTIVKAVAVK